MAERQKEVRIFGETYRRKAQVATIGGLSAHAGQTFLVEYAEATQDTIKEIFLVHGEQKPAQELTAKLKERGLRHISYPALYTSVEI